MTVSIGISTWTSAVEMSLEQLLFAADKALYQAKDSGRNRSCVWLMSVRPSAAPTRERFPCRNCETLSGA
jgi:predicted signal transduction protein with EAL and GGDEF domain